MSLHALADPEAITGLAALRHRADIDRRLFDMESLLTAVQALHNELDLDALSELFVAMVAERLQVRDVALLLHDEWNARLRVTRIGDLPREAHDVSLPATDGILWRLILTGAPFSVIDLSGKPRFPETFERERLDLLRGRVWLPLVMPGKVIGVLSLGASTRPPLPTDLHFLTHLASQAAVAINTARLYQTMTTARRDLDRSLYKLSLLFDVTRALGAASDLTRLLRMILERAISSVSAERGSLMLLDESTEELVVRVVHGLPDAEAERRINNGEIECTRFKRGEGVAGTVLETGIPQRIDDPDASEDFTHRERSPRVKALLCVPLMVDDEAIGVINISNRRRGGAFGDEDLEMLEALASQAAVAIARTRLYEIAITDGLSGLYVRRFAVHRLGEEVRRARRYAQPLTAIMCDVDHFKVVNDTWGHPAGDEVIRRVASLIQQELRADIDIAGRYGGEEFLLVLPHTGVHEGAVCAERIRRVIDEARIAVDGGELHKTMSFGVAELGPDDGADDLIKRADAALYASKRGGRNRVSVARCNEADCEVCEPRRRDLSADAANDAPEPPSLLDDVPDQAEAMIG